MESRLISRLVTFAAVAVVAFASDNGDIRKALDFLARHESAQVALQTKISEIPAPGFHEEQRAAFIASEFRRVGLEDVEIDGIGNVLGWRHGTSPRALVLAAHLDTVFPAGTDVRVKRTADRLVGPGLVDDSRGVAVMISVAEALRQAGIQTKHSLLFVADVGEEGLGNLRGIKYLVGEGKYHDRIDAFISIDGDGANTIFNREIGSRRYRLTITGPGGHSFLDFGRVNPASALGRVMALLAEMKVPVNPKTTYNVGRIGGGTSVNSVPFDAWMEFDMRSEDEQELIRLEQEFLNRVKEGVDDENRFRASSGTELKVDAQRVAIRHAIANTNNASLVAAVQYASEAVGLGKPILKAGSTDSNAAASAGIPAITIDGGGGAGNMHSLEEWFSPAGSHRGIQKVLLTILHWDEQR
jgi:acetylornithine deacetylase/succinyl-diaminopimelate desuccinylase-like protein